MVDIDQFGTALQSLKTGLEILKAFLSNKGNDLDAEAKLQLSDALDSLVDARIAVVESQDQVRELRKKLDQKAAMKFDATESAWLLEDASEPQIWFCAVCWEKEMHQVPLQDCEIYGTLPPQAQALRWGELWYCPSCETYSKRHHKPVKA